MNTRFRIGGELLVTRSVGRDVLRAAREEEGVRSVLDVRPAVEEGELGAEEEAQEAQRLGLEYRHVPVRLSGPDGRAALDAFRREVERLPRPTLVHGAGDLAAVLVVIDQSIEHDRGGMEAVHRVESIGVQLDGHARKLVQDYVDEHMTPL